MAQLHSSERPLALIVALTAAAALTVSTAFGQAVDWIGFMPGIAPGVLLAGLGLYLRHHDNRPKFSNFLVSVGAYVLFGAFMSVTIFCFFPVLYPTIDHQLFRFDAVIGYDWRAAVAWAAQMPLVGKLMGLTYHSSLWQIIAVLAVLSALGRTERQNAFLLAGFVALTAALGVWIVFPSFGPAAYLTVPATQTDAIGLIVNPAYGATLMDYATNGIPVIGPQTIIGAIAFPSFHTVMLCLILWYARKTPAFWPLVVVNILMVPAILIHGGHHVADVFGGIGASAASILVASRKTMPTADAQLAA